MFYSARQQLRRVHCRPVLAGCIRLQLKRGGRMRSKKPRNEKSAARFLPPLDQLQRYPINEAGSYLRMSRARLYEKIAAGELTVIRDGRRTYVPGSEIARL